MTLKNHKCLYSESLSTPCPMSNPSLMLRDKYLHTDKTKEALRDKSELVRQHGLNYLIPTWQRFAEQYVDTQELIYEWLNDLDTRKIIDEVLATLPQTERYTIERELKPLDNMVLAKTFEVNECVWGDEAEKDNAYNRQKHWYYYRMNNHVFGSEGGRFTKRHNNTGHNTDF